MAIGTIIVAEGVRRLRRTTAMDAYIYAVSYNLNYLTGGSRQETFCSRTCRMAYLTPDPSFVWITAHKFNDWLFVRKEPDHCWKSFIRYVELRGP